MKDRVRRLLSVVKHPVTEYQVHKAKAIHREANPRCVICNLKGDILNGRKCDVHHIIPVHIRPDLSRDPDNLSTMCRYDHWLWGHLKNWRSYNPHLKETIEEVQKLYEHFCNIGIDKIIHIY